MASIRLLTWGPVEWSVQIGKRRGSVPQARPPSAVYRQGAAMAAEQWQETGAPSRLRVGDRLVLAEKDYKFGTGPLLVEILTIEDCLRWSDGAWWRVSAHCRSAPGERGRLRGVDIRAAAVPTALQRGGPAR